MKSNTSLRSFLALAGSSLLVVSSVNATQYWDGGGGDANWSTLANWGEDTLPSFGTTINFGGTNAGGTAAGNVSALQTSAVNDLAAGSGVKNIFFTNNGTAGRTQSFTLSGNSILLGTGTNDKIGTTSISGANPAIEDVIEFNIDLGAPAGAQNRVFEAGLSHDLKIDGVISGTGTNISMMKQGSGKLTLTNANNSYVGFTNITSPTGGTAVGGVLEITSIANGGLNSSIGASTNAATNLRFSNAVNATATNTLRYVGGTNGSTDRSFYLGGNTGTSATNSAIESSGAGTLSFTSNAAIAFSNSGVARNLYLGGTNTGDNGFNLPFSNNGTGVNTFTKQGAGKWIVSGDNSYTGATTVSEGTLLINGNSSTAVGAVNVNAGTLGGTGRTGGAVTVAALATLSPGASIESLDVASLGMASTSIFAYEVASNTSTGADLLASRGALSLTGVTLSLDAASVLALGGGGWASGNKLTLISYLGADVTSGFTGYTDDTAYVFGANSWMFNYNDNVAGGNYGTDAVAGGQDRFVTMTYTVIPEPRAALLGGLGLLALLRRRRQ